LTFVSTDWRVLCRSFSDCSAWQAVALIASGGILTGPLVTKHFPLDDYLEAYRFIDQFGDRSMKVVIDVA
jgi:threonine dehydrogenase-like Zn-dependent dehydrogenase